MPNLSYHHLDVSVMAFGIIFPILLISSLIILLIQGKLFKKNTLLNEVIVIFIPILLLVIFYTIIGQNYLQSLFLTGFFTIDFQQLTAFALFEFLLVFCVLKVLKHIFILKFPSNLLLAFILASLIIFIYPKRFVRVNLYDHCTSGKVCNTCIGLDSRHIFISDQSCFGIPYVCHEAVATGQCIQVN